MHNLFSKNLVRVIPQLLLTEIRGVFRAMQNIYYGAFLEFLRILLTDIIQSTFSCYRLSIMEAVTRMCSIKKRVLENFAKFTGMHLFQSLFLNKVSG